MSRDIKSKDRTAKRPIVAYLQRPRHALGQPLKALAEGHFQRLVETAGVRPIKFHGTRHTTATLLLQATTPIQVVSERLGHASVTLTLNTYTHATPNLQQDATTRLGALLAG